MLGCTLKEYVSHFDEKLADYLEEYADNTPISFLENQKLLFGHYQYQIQNILSELTIYGEENASEVFLESNIFEGLKKIDMDSYQNILIEEKPNDIQRLYVRVGEYRSKLKVRVNFTTLKNINSSVDKIVEFLHDKYLKFQSVCSDDETKPLIDLKSEESILENPIDPVLQKIEKYLKPYSHLLLDEDYNLLTNSLLAYFKNGKFPKLEKKITFKQCNKKKIGWALKEIFTSITIEDFSIEYARFAHENINLFKKDVVDEANFVDSNLYKYFHENVKSWNH
jgi:hypothetical protein